MNRNLQWHIPWRGSSSTVSRLNLNLVVVFVKGGKPENPEKNPWSKARINNKLNPLEMPGPGFEPGRHWAGIKPRQG